MKTKIFNFVGVLLCLGLVLLIIFSIDEMINGNLFLGIALTITSFLLLIFLLVLGRIINTLIKAERVKDKSIDVLNKKIDNLEAQIKEIRKKDDYSSFHR